jgi:hypothetical protein
MNIQIQTALACRLTFRHMHNEGRALSFPCDSQGQVLLDQLSERARTNYFYARTTVGREFLEPVLEHRH